MPKTILTAALACFVATTAVYADVWTKMTKVTFSAPVQLPSSSAKAGVLTLSPGTYVFKLVESSASRHVVQVTDLRGTKLYTTILAIPDYRLNPTSKTVMYFSERKGGAPPAIKSWFYPGDNFGQRFVYPKAQAVQVAATVNQPVPSHTVETVVVEKVKVVEVPVYIEKPDKQEVAYAPETFDKLDAADTAGEDGEAVKQPAAEPAPTKLPKTASPVYLLGLLGITLIGASFLVRAVASQLR